MWEANPFNARCAHCGQGYFTEDNPNFCVNCGARLGAPPPRATVKRAVLAGEAAGSTVTSRMTALIFAHLPIARLPIYKRRVKLACRILIPAALVFCLCYWHSAIVGFWKLMCKHWILSALGVWLFGLAFLLTMQIIPERRLGSFFSWIDWHDEELFYAWARRGWIAILVAEILIGVFNAWVLLPSLLWYVTMWLGNCKEIDAIKQHPIATAIVICGVHLGIGIAWSIVF